MNALLVYPRWPDTFWSFKHALPFEGKRSAFPPLGLLTIASLLPAHWNRRLVDTNVRPLRERDLRWADVVLLSGMLVQKESLLEILGRCRRHRRPTVVGGPITSCAPELALHADRIVIGEAEELMPELVQDIESGGGRRVYRAAEMPGLDRTPLPALDLISLRPYSSMTVQFSRGCPFNCEFCDIIEIYGRKPRTKSPAQMLAELELLYRRGWRGSVFLVDDNFIGNKRKVRELLVELARWNPARGYPFTFYTEASLNLADEPELLELMRRAGFTRVFVGIETPVEASLKEAHKMQNTRRDLLESVRRIQRAGLEVMAGFIVGFDNDPPDVFDRQVEFIEQSAIALAMVGLLQAVPGTQLYRRLEAENRLLGPGGGNNTDLHLNFLPRMDVARLLEGYRSILQRIYEPRAYFERVRRFIADYAPAVRRAHSLSDVLALARSMLRQGVLGRARAAYWKLFWEAALRRREAFDVAMTLAIMGYHFQKLTERLLAMPASLPAGVESAAQGMLSCEA